MKLRIMIMTLMIQCVDSVQIAATDEMSPANLVFLLGAIAKQEPTSVSIVPVIIAIKPIDSITAANMLIPFDRRLYNTMIAMYVASKATARIKFSTTDTIPNINKCLMTVIFVIAATFLNPRTTLFIYLQPTVPLLILELIVDTLGYDSYLIPFLPINI